MKQYIKPEIKVSMFSVECVSTDDTADLLSQPFYGQNLDAYIKKTGAVDKNLDFNKAIEFN